MGEVVEMSFWKDYGRKNGKVVDEDEVEVETQPLEGLDAITDYMTRPSFSWKRPLEELRQEVEGQFGDVPDWVFRHHPEWKAQHSHVVVQT